MNKRLIMVGLVSFLLVGCNDKEDSKIEQDSSVVEIEQQDDTTATESANGEVQNIEGEKEVTEDMGTSFVNNLDTHTQEVKNLTEVTVGNYQYIQRLNEKFLAANKHDKNAIDSEVIKKIQELNEEAKKIEESLKKEGIAQTIINAYIEESVGIVAFSADGIVSGDTKFDQVVITLNNRVYNAEISGNKFVVDRKLVLGDKEAKPVVQILLNEKVIEEITVDTIKL